MMNITQLIEKWAFMNKQGLNVVAGLPDDARTDPSWPDGLFTPKKPVKYDANLHKMLQQWDQAGQSPRTFMGAPESPLSPELAAAVGKYMKLRKGSTPDDLDAAHTLLELDDAQKHQNLIDGGYKKIRSPHGPVFQKGDKHYYVSATDNALKELAANTAKTAAEFGAKLARCWAGYEPVPGAKAYSKGSCRPKGSKKTQKEMKKT